ncbi:MAG: hypothetical protein RIR05_1100 [Bacteroidota bacterium]
MAYKYLILLSFTSIYMKLQAQEAFFKESHAHKRLWRKVFKHKREAYNPYLEKKASKKPSAQLQHANHANDAKMKRKDRRRMLRAKRHLH